MKNFIQVILIGTPCSISKSKLNSIIQNKNTNHLNRHLCITMCDHLTIRSTIQNKKYFTRVIRIGTSTTLHYNSKQHYTKNQFYCLCIFHAMFTDVIRYTLKFIDKNHENVNNIYYVITLILIKKYSSLLYNVSTLNSLQIYFTSRALKYILNTDQVKYTTVYICKTRETSLILGGIRSLP